MNEITVQSKYCTASIGKATVLQQFAYLKKMKDGGLNAFVAHTRRIRLKEPA